MKVEIYGKDQCTFCDQAVALCESKQLKYDYIDIAVGENLKFLTERIGARPRTVPQIFLNGTHLPGGFNGLKQELANS